MKCYHIALKGSYNTVQYLQVYMVNKYIKAHKVSNSLLIFSFQRFDIEGSIKFL